LFLNENYKQQIIDCIIDLIDNSSKDKIFEDANLKITKNDSIFYLGVNKRDLHICPILKKEFLFLSVSNYQSLDIIRDKNKIEKKEVLEKHIQTEKIDYFEKMNIFIYKNKLAFKNEALKIENLSKKTNQDFSFIAKYSIKKPEIKIIKQNRFENSDLRLINSYCSPSTHFHIKSLELVKSKKKVNQKALKDQFNNDSGNHLGVKHDNNRKLSTKSLGDVNILKLNNISRIKNNNNSNNYNNKENKSQISNSKNQVIKNFEINSFTDKLNDISNNPGYMLCESINNININTTNNINESSLEKTNLDNREYSTNNNNIDRDESKFKKEHFNHQDKNRNSREISHKVKDNVKTHFHKINILENICSDCESEEEKQIEKLNKKNGISIGIQADLINEINPNNNSISKPLETNKISDNFNIINDHSQKGSCLNEDKIYSKNSNIKNLNAPFRSKITQNKKKKEELKIIIESYFSINSYRVNESLLIKSNKKLISSGNLNNIFTNYIASPTRGISKNLQPTIFNTINTNNNLNNEIEAFNNLNSSTSTNIYNNNFNNYSRYLGSGLSGNINEKIISSSILTGANNINLEKNNIIGHNYLNPNNNNNLYYQTESLEISEKDYEIRNEVSLFYRKVKFYDDNEIQTDLLSVIILLM